jgi:hypothetical protein
MGERSAKSKRSDASGRRSGRIATMTGAGTGRETGNGSEEIRER